MRKPNILFVVPCSPYFPSGLVRVEAYLPYYEEQGIQYKLINFNTPTVQKLLHWLDRSFFSKWRITDLFFRIIFHLSGLPYRWFRLLQILVLTKKYDLIFLQSIFLPSWYSKILTKVNPRVVFDYDDALYYRNEHRIQEIIQNAWKVIAGSHVLYDYASQYNSNVIIIPSSVPLENYKLEEKKKSQELLRIGWIGGPSTLKNLKILEEPFQELVRKGLAFEFLIAGSYGKKTEIPQFKGVKVIEIPVYESGSIPELVQSCDIGVMPLYDEPWERGKCAMKALICMAGALPVVCSPVGEPEYIFQDGKNGFLAFSNQDWIDKLTELLTNEELRIEVGKAGRLTIERQFSTEVSFSKLMIELFEQSD